MSFLDEEALELYVLRNRLALIVELSQAAFQQGSAADQEAWLARLTQLTGLETENLRRWYGLAWIDALFDMLSHPKVRHEAGTALCHQEDLGERCQELVALLPELGIYAARALQKGLPLSRRLEIARPLEDHMAIEVLGDKEADRATLEFLLQRLASDRPIHADLALITPVFTTRNSIGRWSFPIFATSRRTAAWPCSTTWKGKNSGNSSHFSNAIWPCLATTAPSPCSFWADSVSSRPPPICATPTLTCAARRCAWPVPNRLSRWPSCSPTPTNTRVTPPPSACWSGI